MMFFFLFSVLKVNGLYKLYVERVLFDRDSTLKEIIHLKISNMIHRNISF